MSQLVNTGKARRYRLRAVKLINGVQTNNPPATTYTMVTEDTAGGANVTKAVYPTFAALQSDSDSGYASKVNQFLANIDFDGVAIPSGTRTTLSGLREFNNGLEIYALQWINPLFQVAQPGWTNYQHDFTFSHNPETGGDYSGDLNAINHIFQIRVKNTSGSAQTVRIRATRFNTIAGVSYHNVDTINVQLVNTTWAVNEGGSPISQFFMTPQNAADGTAKFMRFTIPANQEATISIAQQYSDNGTPVQMSFTGNFQNFNDINGNPIQHKEYAIQSNLFLDIVEYNNQLCLINGNYKLFSRLVKWLPGDGLTSGGTLYPSAYVFAIRENEQSPIGWVVTTDGVNPGSLFFALNGEPSFDQPLYFNFNIQDGVTQANLAQIIPGYNGFQMFEFLGVAQLFVSTND